MRKRIDAHVHIMERVAGFASRGELYAIGGGKARWANGDVIQLFPPDRADRNFTAEILLKLLDDFSIEKAVILQGSFYGFQNDYIADSVRKYPDRLKAAAAFDPYCVRAQEIFDRLCGEMGFRIFKFEVSPGAGLSSYHSGFPLDGMPLAPYIEKIAALGATLVLDLGSPGVVSWQPQAVARIAQKYPDLKIVICHLLAPKPGDRRALEYGLHTLALPNVWFDLAAVESNVRPEKYPYPTGRDYIALGKEIAGADKLIWGTDTPSTLTRDTYPHLISYIEESGIFTEPELDKVFYQNAKDAYSL